MKAVEMAAEAVRSVARTGTGLMQGTGRWIGSVVARAASFLSFGARPQSRSVGSPARSASPSRTIPAYLQPAETVDRLALLQQIWGEGCLFPGGIDQGLNLVKPFGIDSSMSLLDLSAGLGGPSRRIATTFDVYITGMEPNKEAAERGHKLSVGAGLGKQIPITAYNPEALTLKPRAFNGVYGQLLLSPIEEKLRLLEEIRKSLRPNGQLTFRDFVRGPNCDEAALRRLNRLEPSPLDPWRLDEVHAGLRSANLNGRVAEDVSDTLERDMLFGWRDFMQAFSIPVSHKRALGVVVDEAELWHWRLEAMRAGVVRFYRFYATVPPQTL